MKKDKYIKSTSKKGKIYWDWEVIQDAIANGKTRKEIVEETGIALATLNRKISTINTVKENFNEEVEFERLAKATTNLKINQRKLTHERREVNKKYRNLSLNELIIEKANLEKPLFKKGKKTKEIDKTNSLKIFLGDLHFQHIGNSIHFENLNEKILEQVKDYSFVEFFLMGDYIESNNHPDQLVEGVSSVEQTNWIANWFTDLFNEVSFKVEKVNVNMIPGNHDRTQRKHGIAVKDENFATLIYHFIKRSTNVNIKYDNDYIITKDELDKNIMIMHGDHFRGDNAKGRETWIQDFEAQNDKKIDYYVLGHSHKFEIHDRKGTGRKIIKVPAAKSERSTNRFEFENNQKSTTGFITIEYDKYGNEVIKHIK